MNTTSTPDFPRPPAVRVMRNLGLEPDSWQIEVLEAGHRRLLLNCSRQAGKSTVVAMLALVEAIWTMGTKVLLLSRSQRQAGELFRIVVDCFRRLGSPMVKRQTVNELELDNLSRIICLPCNEQTIRGFAHVNLLIIDEAARVPDDLYRAVRPMLAVSGGRLICLSTPYGKRGFFYDAWANSGNDWARIEIPAERISRISADFLQQERRALGESWFRQEYCCSFEALEGLVYPDFARCVVPAHDMPFAGASGSDRIAGKRVGGIDFGFRNPFATVWGTLDGDGVLWLTGEHYARNKPLSYHADRLPRDVLWYADPSGANERCELGCAGFTVRQGDNALRPGIAAVSARVENGTLRIQQGRCPNLLAEAGLYRYADGSESRGETPVADHNHALDALRYLISGIDARRQVRRRRDEGEDESKLPAPKSSFWTLFKNEALWTRI